MQNMIFKRKLPIPKEIKEQYPLTAELAQVKARRDKEIADVFTGKSGKMVLIIGPCSADREDAVLEYCERLAKLQEAVSDKLVLIPRVYTNKPRTTGDGYKGLLHQPDPRKTSDMLEGVIAIRRLHTNVLANTGLPTADEMLYPDNYRYLSMQHYDAGTTDWAEEAALSFLETGKGNCYCFAGLFMYCARQLGYQAYVVAGWESNPTNDHAWTMIEQDGKTLLYDAQLEYAYLYMFHREPVDMFGAEEQDGMYRGFRYYFPEE